MKSRQIPSRRWIASIFRGTRGRAACSLPDSDVARNGLLYVLMAPSMAAIYLNYSFGVALPALRDAFALDADVASWLVTANALPFIMLMPLYGRMGDYLGKRNLIVGGLLFFLLGTLITIGARSTVVLITGRAIQGAGIAGIVPLSIAIITERFPAGERGRALGTWNSIGPLMGIVAPLVAGYSIDRWGWRSIFVPILLLGLVAALVVWRFVPSLRAANFNFLRSFDWGGVVLLALTVIFAVFYVSSRPITGVDPLQDWRLLAIALLCGAAFVWYERRRADPFLNLALFVNPSLRWASIGAGLRMFTMSGISFLMPLYLADVFNLSASATGGVIMLNSITLLSTMRLGGLVADRWGGRGPVMLGMAVQTSSMLCFALLPASVPLPWIVAGITVHGLGAGLSLAAFHAASLSHTRTEENGAAAGSTA